MNGNHHQDLTACALHLAGIPDEAAAPIIPCASAPDHFDDVFVVVPFGDPQPRLFGQQLTSLQHFQRSDGRGYCWRYDPSLGCLEEIGDAGMHVAGMRVDGKRGPITSSCLVQQGATLGDFVFPSAARMAAYWGEAPFGGKETGHLAHFIQDSCIPHHGWGALLFGHQEFEDTLEDEWFSMRNAAEQASDPKAFSKRFAAEVRKANIGATTLPDLVADNAAWARTWFGQPRPLDECTNTDALAICIRAVASTIRAIEITRKKA